MPWWAWVILGFLLLLAELVTPGGFYFLFFGAGAIVVGIVAVAGFGGPAWFQWAMFSVFSLATLGVLRKPLLERFRGRPRDLPSSDDVDALVGETAIALEQIVAGGMGKVELRGSGWSARNLGSDALASGQRCKVETVEGLVLGVRSQNKAAAGS